MTVKINVYVDYSIVNSYDVTDSNINILIDTNKYVA